MKILIRLMNITLIISGIIGFSSCEKRNSGDTGKGKVEFSFNLPSEIDQVKSGHVTDSGIISYHLLVSVEDLNGNLVLSDSLIPLYTFGTGYVSEDVELKAGEYRLTKFMVINPAGKVVYAAPVAGSPLAYLVNRPLPFSFNIYPNEVTKILPEVLAVGDHSPDQFGYASFGMQIIKPLIFWTICILNDSLVLSPTQITQANLTVYADSIDWHYTFGLEAAVNRLVIRAGSETYTFMLEKEGYLSQTMQFSAKDLLATSKEYPLVLKIPFYLATNDTIWYENFESYASGSFPNSWIADGNGTNTSINYIDDSIFYTGEKSLRLFGLIGDCWGTLAYRPIEIDSSLTIELAVRNGNENLSGCHPDRAYIGLRQGTSWTNPSRMLVAFYGDGNIYSSGKEVDLGNYSTNSWYKIRIKYIKTHETVKISYWINGVYKGTAELNKYNHEDTLDHIDLTVQEGTVWFDDVRIMK